MGMVKTDARWEALDQIIARGRGVNGPLIQVLHEAQDLFGYLPDEVQLRIAEGLGIAPSRVRGVVTFYNFFRTEKTGQHMISVCTGTACHVKGAEGVLNTLHELLGVGPGETTEDGAFTLETVRCIGACGLSPAMMVDEEVYGKLDRKKITEILATYRP